MKKKTLLVLGAKSDIGIAVAHAFAKKGFDIQLASRNSKTLKDDCSDITIRYGVLATFHEIDALDLNSHEKFISTLPKVPNIAFSAIGVLYSQQECEKDIKKSLTVMRTNFEGIVSILSHFANLFQERGSGAIIGISSVAGDRGRASNYIYGASKAGFTAFLSGLRNRLYPYGVDVITIKPGFVRTKMTKHIDLPNSLTSNSKKVAHSIYLAYKNKKNIIYVEPIWKYIMGFIKIIPENIFKRLKL